MKNKDTTKTEKQEFNTLKSKGALLLRLYRGAKLLFGASVILNALQIAATFLAPLLVGYTADFVIGNSVDGAPSGIAVTVIDAARRFISAPELLICSIAIGVFALLAFLFGFAYRAVLAVASERFVKNLRDGLYEHSMRLPVSWHNRYLTGDLIQRCTTDVNTMREFARTQLIILIRVIITIVIAIVIVFGINTRLALVVSCSIPIVAVYSYVIGKVISKYFQANEEVEGELTTDIQENLTANRVVRAFGREEYETEKFGKLNEKYTQQWIKSSYIMGLFWSVADLMSYVTLLAVLSVGSVFVARGEMSFGELLVFLSCTQQVSWPVRQLGRTLSDMTKASVALGRLNEIYSGKPETTTENGKTPDMTGDIVFHNVRFSYPAPVKVTAEGEEVTEQPQVNTEPVDVLCGLDLTIAGGSTLGVLGATGSGKSTLTYLLTRMWELPEDCGEISVSGVDTREIPLHYLRENIGLVLQETFLYSKTVAENIAITSSCAPDLDIVREKAAIASVDGDILGFEKGYDTIIGERGVTLSGGQKQRVAIARTLLKNAPIMVFDDSMSAVDTDTDRNIRQGIRAATKKATVIIISHRISTLMAADKIAVMEDGRITEFGTHSELLALGGHYRRVYDIQSAYDEEGGESAFLEDK
ncbi:MAG: ABC transporter ATP-binding protein/permease [Oscillospiraceae bacterium]|jgi:ATP-binding cassette subfamily B protein|nr:ABC transporter ATP-binding protein/permease [Oscillospiraceae bacterium]